ncbi:uncharacterized protein LOC134719531 [Mytilus trossulus]|uniref:uncharacterized protein LOC134719531 n=1 Tax=Mytilus trossulus TaxID=6551 RepID=UPI003006AB70
MIPSDLACTVSASRGIDVRHLSDQLTKVLIEQCCPLRQTIDRLIQIRNKVQGHSSDGRISDPDYVMYKSDIESGIMEIARVCKTEAITKQSLLDLNNRSLDETLCIQYQNMLLEQMMKEKRLEEGMDELVKTIPESIENTLNNNMPDIVETLVDKVYDKINSPEEKLTEDQKRTKSKRIEDTFLLVQSHTSQDTFVSSNALNKAMMNLEDKGVQILTGTAGTGKSRNSLELLRQYSTNHAGYHGIKLQQVQEWRDIICKDDLLFVLFDDIFGQTSFHFTADDENIF